MRITFNYLFIKKGKQITIKKKERKKSILTIKALFLYYHLILFTDFFRDISYIINMCVFFLQITF